jgi:hypothetical protein
MLGFPAATEIKKLITKKKVYERFASEMSADRRKSFDADIARITVVNEISPASLNIADGTDVHAFFVVAVVLRRKDFDKQNITLIARMFGQNLVLLLSYEQEERLALWQTKLIMNEWCPAGSQSLPLQGLNMDALWEGAVTEIGGLQLEAGRTLNEQIALNDQWAKLQKQIEKLEKQARNEKQPKRKLELAQKIKKMKLEMEAL